MAFSEKQLEILRFPMAEYEALICDGAVRSGKTSIMSLSFILWAMDCFNRCNFAFCGKSVGSVERNIIRPLLAIRYLQKEFELVYTRSDHTLIVRRGEKENTFYLFGGKDESSYTLIQGITLAGVLLDEVVLMPESFVNQALARCSVDGAKLWFSCNPGNPQHWFKTEWIDQKEDHNALYLHFEMTDNPSLSEKTLARYRSMYPAGVFYDRYILGLWVAAEGLVYPMFDRERHVLTEEPPTEGDYYVSADFGTQNANVWLLWRKERGTKRWICLREDYYSGRDEKHQLTVSQLVDRLDAITDGIDVKQVIIDPSAAPMKTELHQRRYHTRNADNDVLNGIQDVCTMLGAGNLAFMACCKKTIEEFGAYMWDSKAIDRGEDAPLKESDHAMDGIRYLCRTLRLVRRSNRRELPA